MVVELAVAVEAEDSGEVVADADGGGATPEAKATCRCADAADSMITGCNAHEVMDSAAPRFLLLTNVSAKQKVSGQRSHDPTRYLGDLSCDLCTVANGKCYNFAAGKRFRIFSQFRPFAKCPLKLTEARDGF